MSLYDDLKPVASQLLAEFKQGVITLINIAVSGAVDSPTNVETTYPLSGTVRGVTYQYLKDSFVVASDLIVTVAVVDGVKPTSSDFIEIDGARHKIIKDISIPAAGTQVAWKFIVRAVGVTADSSVQVIAGTYLPGTPYFVGSVARRLVAGFNGPAVRLVRLNDSVESDFPFELTSDNLDLKGIASWAGGSNLAVKTVYDQTGSTRTLTQATAVNMPRFNFAGDNGFAVCSCDTPSSLNNNTPRGLAMSGISLERTTCSIFQTERNYYNPNRCFWELITTVGGARDLGYIGSSTGSLNLGQNLPTTAFQKAQVQTSSVVSSITAIDARLGDQNYLGLTPMTAKVSTGFNINKSTSDVSKFCASDIYATVIYDTVRADAAAIHAQLGTIFGEAGSRAERVIFDGDSLTAGYGANMGKTTPWYTMPKLSKACDMGNFGQFGFRYVSAYPAVATRIGNILRTSDVLVVRYGTNDISNGDTAATIYTSLQTYLTNIRAVVTPKAIVICTIPPNGTYDSTQETTRLSFNTLLRAGVATLGVTLADNDTNPVFTAACRAADPIYTRAIHYTDAGYAFIAGLELPAINSVI